MLNFRPTIIFSIILLFVFKSENVFSLSLIPISKKAMNILRQAATGTPRIPGNPAYQMMHSDQLFFIYHPKVDRNGARWLEESQRLVNETSGIGTVRLAMKRGLEGVPLDLADKRRFNSINRRGGAALLGEILGRGRWGYYDDHVMLTEAILRLKSVPAVSFKSRTYALVEKGKFFEISWKDLNIREIDTAAIKALDGSHERLVITQNLGYSEQSVLSYLNEGFVDGYGNWPYFNSVVNRGRRTMIYSPREFEPLKESDLQFFRSKFLGF